MTTQAIVANSPLFLSLIITHSSQAPLAQNCNLFILHILNTSAHAHFYQVEAWRTSNLDPELFCACRGEGSRAHSQTRKHWGQEWADFHEIADCVTTETFEAKIKSLKDCLKTNKSSVNVFVEEDFYQRVKNYLKIRTEQELDIAPSIKTPELSKAEINTVKRKKWKYANGKLLTTEGKEVAHQGMLFDILSKCHHRIAHRGRQKTEKWIAENYSEVTQKVVNTFCFSLPFSRRAKTHNHQSETRGKSSSS